jgi:hypothetical protein
MPIAVLIGTIYALARLAQSSQYTILRTSGLAPGPGHSGILASLALAFGAFTFVVGDYLAPISARVGSQLRAAFSGSLKLGRSGAWIKEHSSGADGERSYSINVGSAERGTKLRDVRIFEFDADGRLLSRTAAAQAAVGRDGTWSMSDVTVTRWVESGAVATAREERLAALALAQLALARRRRGGGAAGDDDVDDRALALHRPPRRQRAGGADAADPVLEPGPLPVRLPGDGRTGAAVRLPARALGRRQREGLRRHHARRQLRPPQQRLSPPRPARQLDAVGRRRDSRSALSRAFARRLQLAGPFR